VNPIPEPSAVPFSLSATLEILRHTPATLGDILATCRGLRERNLATLEGWRLAAADLARSGTHAEFGRVTLARRFAARAVHDVGHVSQIMRWTAARCRADLGPWRACLRILGTD
jgi:hypothetical protein